MKFALVLLVALVSFVNADKVKKRAFDLDIKKDDVYIVAKTVGEGLKDEVRFRIQSQSSYARAEVDYKFAEKATRTKTKTNFELRVYSIMEYEPTDITKGYQEGVDTLVSTYPDNNWSWQDIVFDNSTGVNVFTITDTGNVFSLIGKINQEETGRLSPNHIKFDVAIDNFPYQGTDTALALYCRIESSTKIKPPVGQTLPVDLEDSEEDTPSGSLSWVETVEVDTDAGSETSNVVFSEKPGNGEKSKGVYFTFSTLKNASRYFWDPELGVTYPDELNGAPSSSQISLFSMAIGLLVATLFAQ